MKILARVEEERFELNLKVENGEKGIEFSDGDIVTFRDQPDPGIYSAGYGNKSFTVYVTETASGYQVQIGQDHLQVEIQDERSQLLESLGMKSTRQEVDGIVKAPIPGLLMKLMVSVGEEVQPGQALAILEAMKMENEIHAPHGGSVEEIYIKEGEQVDKDQPLLKIKD